MIYRRVDDLFLDPEAFRPDSALGVPGLMRAWRAGNVAIANAPGAGVADDKVVYAWVPDIIRYYLGEEPLAPQRADLPLPRTPTSGGYVLDHLDELVVKPANESGGYGILIGSRATAEELATRVGADRGRPPQLGRPADPDALDRAHARATAASSPATSTCGPFILTGAHELRDRRAA